MNLEEIKNQLDIVEVVAKYVKLRHVGKYYSGLCPFHKETKPSFYVSPELQIFKCFGCGESGDVFKFLMKIENLTFNEVLEKIRTDYGFEIKSEPRLKLNKKILEINYASLKFFRKQLQENKNVLNYLKKRGLTNDTIDKFELGFSPGNVLLRDYLYSIGYEYQLIKEAGLLDSKNFDRFQSRIIFPLRDENGRLVGFTGRIFPEDNRGPKYLNSPETEIFKKSHFLYGLYYAKDYIIQFKKVILVEGQFDFLLAWQNNHRYLVAVSGSALTPYHLRKLKKFTSKIIFAFDNDPAGFKASLRANLMAKALGFNTFQLKYQAKDLADFFITGKEKFEEEKFEDYLLDFLLTEYGKENKEKILEIFLPQIKNLKPLEAENYVKKLSQQIDINQEILFRELNNLPEANLTIVEGKERQFVEETSLEDKFSMRLISLIYAFREENNENNLSELRSILSAKFNHLLNKVLTNKLDSEESEYLEMTKNFYLATNLNFKKELSKTLVALKTIILKNKLKKLNEELKLSRPEESDKIIKMIQDIAQELKTLSRNEKKN